MIIDLQNAEHYNWRQNCDGWHFLKRDDLSIIKERVPPGGMEIAHFHKVSRQFFYILSGQTEIEMEVVKNALSAGQGIEVPPGITHKFKNVSNNDV